MKKKLYIGIDGGGSNSRLSAIDHNGKEIARTNAGSVNLTSVSEARVKKNISQLFETLHELQDATPVYVMFSSAGADTPDYIQSYKTILNGPLAKFSVEPTVHVINEGECLLRTLWNQHQGKDILDLVILVIAGTGIISFSCSEPTGIQRKSGWGHIIDDMGGAYWVAHQSLRLAIRNAELESNTGLLKDTLHYIGLTHNQSLIDYVYKDPNYREKIAALCPFFIEWSHTHTTQNDASAYCAQGIQTILNQTINEWCTQIHAHIDEYKRAMAKIKTLQREKISIRVYTTGSLITSTHMFEALKSSMPHDLKKTLYIPPFEACYGAALLAQHYSS